MEINIGTDKMVNKLTHAYVGWEVLKHVIKSLEYKIIRNKKQVLLKTKAITYVVRRKVPIK